MSRCFNRVLIVGIILITAFSCKEDERVEVPEIINISFVDYPGTTFRLVKDSIPDTFVNSENLPMDAGQNHPIRLKMETKNFHSAEVYLSGTQSINLFSTDTFSLGYKPLYFIKVNSSSGLNRIYALRMIRTSPQDPQILSVDLQLDPSGKSPLAGVVKVTSDKEVKLAYTVRGQDGEDFSMETPEYATSQEINLFGLYADYTNQVMVQVTDRDGLRTFKELFVKTQPLPAILPQLNEIKVNKADLANSVLQFVMFFPVRTTGLPTDPGDYYPMAVDRFGKIRWYLKFPMDNNSIMKKLKNGHWMFTTADVFSEVDLLGVVYAQIPLGFPMHHDFTELPNGDILYLADNTDTHNTLEDVIYRVGRDGSIKDMIDLYTILDPTRPVLPSVPDSRDWFHANCLFYESSDNSIIISGRHQSAVVKMDLDTKNVQWILSDPTYWNEDLSKLLLTPTGDNFTQQYGQHSPVFHPSNPSRLILFDNGNGRSYTSPLLPSQSFSRLVEYKIDGSTVSQQFEFGRQYGSQLFAPYVGNVGFIGDTKYFICFGGIYKDNSGNAIDINTPENVPQMGVNSVRFMEINNQGAVHLDISIDRQPAATNKGIRSYRAYPFNFN